MKWYEIILMSIVAGTLGASSPDAPAQQRMADEAIADKAILIAAGKKHGFELCRDVEPIRVQLPVVPAGHELLMLTMSAAGLFSSPVATRGMRGNPILIGMATRKIPHIMRHDTAGKRCCTICKCHHAACKELCVCTLPVSSIFQFPCIAGYVCCNNKTAQKGVFCWKNEEPAFQDDETRL